MNYENKRLEIRELYENDPRWDNAKFNFNGLLTTPKQRKHNNKRVSREKCVCDRVMKIALIGSIRGGRMLLLKMNFLALRVTRGKLIAISITHYSLFTVHIYHYHRLFFSHLLLP